MHADNTIRGWASEWKELTWHHKDFHLLFQVSWALVPNKPDLNFSRNYLNKMKMKDLGQHIFGGLILSFVSLFCAPPPFLPLARKQKKSTLVNVPSSIVYEMETGFIPSEIPETAQKLRQRRIWPNTWTPFVAVSFSHQVCKLSEVCSILLYPRADT